MSVGVRNPHAEVPPLEPGRIDEQEEKRERSWHFGVHSGLGPVPRKHGGLPEPLPSAFLPNSRLLKEVSPVAGAVTRTTWPLPCDPLDLPSPEGPHPASCLGCSA